MSLAETSDGFLAARAADGDPRAFEVLTRRHGSYLLAFATRLLASPADADDVVQEALITAWQKLPELREPARVRSWLSAIVSRGATDRMRARRAHIPIDALEHSGREPASPEGLGAPERSAEVRSQLEALSRVLAALPEALRTVWVLREVRGASYEEIAADVGESPATVRGRLARARARVLEGMEEWR